MTNNRKILLVANALAVAIVAALVLIGPSMRRGFFYPKPRALPPVVDQTTDQLLGKLRTVLETKAPFVFASLQPGLSDAQISALESQGDFRLSEDLRAFYRWHNGSATNSTVGLLAGQRFLPLDDAVRKRALFQRHVSSAAGIERAALSIFTGHRMGWLQILDDGAGDGYFYDPNRTDAQGAFFYHFAEVSYYEWFPSFRNFLAGVIECYESQTVWAPEHGNALEQDFDRAREIWRRLAEVSE